MRTPDEIKEGLERCKKDKCDECPYEPYCPATGGLTALAGDALAYIQQLEAAHRTEYCDEADYDCVELGRARRRIAALEAELTATRQELARQGDLCAICINKDAQGGEDCALNCISCGITSCECYKCFVSGAEDGYKWDGGATNGV